MKQNTGQYLVFNIIFDFLKKKQNFKHRTIRFKIQTALILFSNANNKC